MGWGLHEIDSTLVASFVAAALASVRLGLVSAVVRGTLHQDGAVRSGLVLGLSAWMQASRGAAGREGCNIDTVRKAKGEEFTLSVCDNQ